MAWGRASSSRQPHHRTCRPCLLSAHSGAESERHGESRAASSWQRCPAPCPALPRRAPPTAAGRTGQERSFRERTLSQRICFAWLRTLPSTARQGRQLPRPARGRGQRWPPAGAPRGVGSPGARDADTGAGCGPAGALPAQTGSCSQLMAAWQRAGSEDRLRCIWPRREGGGTPGGEVTGCPVPGMRSSASTLGDIPTARPFAVPSDPPWMLEYPACPSCASPPSRAMPTLPATAGGHVLPFICSWTDSEPINPSSRTRLGPGTSVRCCRWLSPQ